MPSTFGERHRHWESTLARPGRVIWSNESVSRWISGWCLMHHLTHANGLRPRELIEPLQPGRSWDHLRERGRSFLRMGWLPSAPLVGYGPEPALLAPLEAIRRCIPERFLGPWTYAISTAKRLRLCHGCCTEGYHSIFHQIVGVARCPIHDQAIVTTCCRCGYGTPEFSVASAVNPFRCSNCRAPLLLMPSSVLCRSEDFKRTEASAWNRFAGWLERIVATVTPEVRGAPFVLDSSGEPVREAQFLWILNEVIPLPREVLWFLVPPVVKYRTINVAYRDTAPVDDDDLSQREHEGGHEERNLDGVDVDYHALIAERTPVWKSIARHLRRHHLREHRHCREMARYWFRVVDFGPEAGFAELWIDGCAVAQAYQWWVTSLRRRVARFRPRPYAIHDAEDTPIRRWGHRLLSAFYARVETTRASIEALRRERDAGKSMELCTLHLIDRLDLRILGFNYGSTVVSLTSGPSDVRGTHEIVIGLPAPPDMERASCPTCKGRGRKAAHSRSAIALWFDRRENSRSLDLRTPTRP